MNFWPCCGWTVFGLAIAMSCSARAQTWNVAVEYSGTSNPTGPWSYGWSSDVGGSPVLTSDAASLPWLGATFVGRLMNLEPGPFSVPLVILGGSRGLWGAVALPLDLTYVGMPGCHLYTDPIMTLPLTNAGGTATWPMDIPNTPSLVGATFYMQGAVISPGTNPVGLVMTNAVEARIGTR